jgi:hypothetical protein
MLIEHQMKMHELYAYLHMTKALTGEYKKRVGKVTRGDGYVLKDQEILEDTIQTAHNHIRHFLNCADSISEKLEERSIPNKDIKAPDFKTLNENWYAK